MKKIIAIFCCSLFFLHSFAQNEKVLTIIVVRDKKIKGGFSTLLYYT
jgi:hypothetical protein